MSFKITPMLSGSRMSSLDMDETRSRTETIINERGQKLYARHWPAENETRALAFISHGYAEHLCYYEDLAISLSDNGIHAFGHDHIGHGKSDGIRAHLSAFDHFVNDVLKHCDKVKHQYPNLPIFIIGHSMGGMIAIKSAMKRPDFFSGVVLMGPLVKPDPKAATPLKTGIAKALAKILPYIKVGSLEEKHITRDIDSLSKIKQDSLRYHGGMRAKFASVLLESMNMMGKQLEDIEWPFLILTGEKDKICDPSGSKELLQRSNSVDKKLKIFPNAYHNLYVELTDVRTEAVEDTVNWIQERLPVA